MDFSDLFKKKMVSPIEELVDENSIEKMDGALLSIDSDGIVKSDIVLFVKKNYNIDLAEQEINSSWFEVLKRIIIENAKQQNEFEFFSNQCKCLSTQKLTLERNVDLLNRSIESFKKDQQTMNSRFIQINAEHREVRNHWIAEKSDLECRLFQMQALQTQYQATLKKKDKDFDKLQNQLSKTIKDLSRGQKCFMTVSLPLKKNLTQEVASSSCTLKDAEIIAAKKAFVALKMENANQKEALESVQANISTLQQQFEQSLHDLEQKYKQKHSELAVNQENFENDALSNIVDCAQAKNKTKKISFDDATNSKHSRKSDQAIIENGHSTASSDDFKGAQTPSRDEHIDDEEEEESIVERKFLLNSASKKYLSNINTPSSRRDMQWVVQQVNTEVKRLRQHAESIFSTKTLNIKNSDELLNDTADAYESFKKIRDELPTTVDAKEYEYFLFHKQTALKKQLMEALQIIQQQDCLIHDALLGKLRGLKLDMLPWHEEKKESLIFENNSFVYENVCFETNEKKVLDKKSANNEKISTFNDSDFLPPASPETMELLKNFGWMTLPAPEKKNTKNDVSAVLLTQENSYQQKNKKKILDESLVSRKQSQKNKENVQSNGNKNKKDKKKEFEQDTGYLAKGEKLEF